jgi:hypothetical protein
MADQGKPGGTPNGAQGTSDDLPEWLSSIPGVDMDKVRADKDLTTKIKGYGLREADYTKKNQEIAPLRKLRERLGDSVDLEKELDRVYSRDGWLAQNWPGVEARLNRLDQLEAEMAKRPAQSNGADHAAPTNRRITTDDLFEQDRLDAALSRWETGLTDGFKNWYQNEEIPRLDRQANHYLNTVMSALTAIWPKDMTEKGVTLQRLLKENALAGGRQTMTQLAADLMNGTAANESSAEQRGYERAKRELEEERKANGTPPPPGLGPAPTWRRPDAPVKKGDRSAMFESVMADVERKHGALPR